MTSTELLFTLSTKFRVIDWVLFAFMLILSGVTGVYFAYSSRKKPHDVQDYLLGSRTMRTFPVAMSLIGSYISGVTIVGSPSEIYTYGSQYMLIFLSVLLSGVLVAVIYLPVYFALKIDSSYAYLELRFDRSLRILASIIFLFDEVLFLPLVIFVPAIAFSQVTGINHYIIGACVCILCIFYTVLGGLKAVVWTDTWQVAIMVGAVIMFAIVGIVNAGGFGPVFEKARLGDRLIFFDYDPSPFKRHTIWTVLIGGTMYWTSFNAVNMTMVQRYMSLPNRQQAELAMLIFSLTAAFMLLLCCFMGLLIFQEFGFCDPRAVGAITSNDQLLPAYVSIVANKIPGALGVFIAGIFGAALSSMSVVLNSSATVVLEDMVKGIAKKEPSAKISSWIARGTSTIIGLISLGMFFFVDKLGGVLNVATSFSAIASGAMFGVFSLGMLWPWANARGAMAGALCGILMGSWVSFGSQTAISYGLHSFGVKDQIVSECHFNTTINLDKQEVDPETVFPLYRLSFNWIAPIDIVTTFLVGVAVSAFTKTKPYTELDPNLFSPVIHRFFPEDMMKNSDMASKKLKIANEETASPTTDLLLSEENNKTNKIASVMR